MVESTISMILMLIKFILYNNYVKKIKCTNKYSRISKRYTNLYYKTTSPILLSSYLFNNNKLILNTHCCKFSTTKYINKEIELSLYKPNIGTLELSIKQHKYLNKYKANFTDLTETESKSDFAYPYVDLFRDNTYYEGPYDNFEKYIDNFINNTEYIFQRGYYTITQLEFQSFVHFILNNPHILFSILVSIFLPTFIHFRYPNNSLINIPSIKVKNTYNYLKNYLYNVHTKNLKDLLSTNLIL